MCRERLDYAYFLFETNDLITAEEEPNGKRPLGRPKLRFEDRVKREVER